MSDRDEDATTLLPRLFFIHVMKTGGTTFRRHLEAQLGADRVYPTTLDTADRFTAYTSVSRLRELPERHWARVDAVAAHLPFFASTVLDRPFVTATILRNPVDRTVSHLKNCQQHDPNYRGWPLEKIYDDPWLFPLQFHNHQVRFFALRASDGADTFFEPIEIDDSRLQHALDNIASVDLFGVHERYDEFVDTVHRRFGWERRSKVANWLVSGPADVPGRLLDRIREDNAADIEFFEQADELHRYRSG